MTILVCGTARSSADQIETHCNFCGGTIFHRPNVSPDARKMCLSCSIPTMPTRRPIMDDLHHLLHRATQRLDALWEDAKVEVTPRQWAVLTAAAADDRCSQVALVDATGIDRSTLSDVVRRLLAKKLVTRQRTKKDARAYAIRLTDEGRAVITRNTARVANVNSQAADALIGADRVELARLLTTIAFARPIPSAPLARTSQSDVAATAGVA